MLNILNNHSSAEPAQIRPMDNSSVNEEVLTTMDEIEEDNDDEDGRRSFQ